MVTTSLSVEVDPAELGFDSGRLARIDRHFASYVEDGRLPGWLAVVARDGQVVHVGSSGMRDVEAGLPVEHDTLWRIYSMTKPITAVAAMSLFEEGRFSLNDPVSRWIPSFADVRVYRTGPPTAPVTVPSTEPVRMWHLLSHTAGLTYGFTYSSQVDAIYRAAGSDFGQPRGMDLAQVCDLWASLPLLFEPGSAWNYSVATDVLGRVCEVLDGKPLDEVFRDRVLGPLGMHDTRWYVEGPDVERLAALYVPDSATGRAVRHDAVGAAALRKPDLLSGGGGLVGTAADYHRFTSMLLGGGALDGVRVLGPRTLAYMTRNHLPGGQTLAQVGRGQFAEAAYEGMGFGLGFSVLVDPVAGKVPATAGEYGWGGAASTAFWIDPVERVTASFFTQLLPSSTYPVRGELRQLVYSALLG